MSQFGSSSVAGQPDPELLQQLRIIKALPALPNNPLLGGGGGGGGTTFTYNATTGWIETVVGPTTYAALPVQGDAIRANVIPRIGTLDTLMNLAGNVGELGSTTDQTGVVFYNGVQFQARALLPYYLIDIAALTNGTVAVPLGVTRIVLGFFSAQTTAVTSVTLAAASVEKVGHSWDILYIPRNASDSVYVNTPAGNIGWFNDGSGLKDYGTRASIIKSASGWIASSPNGFVYNATYGWAGTQIGGATYAALPIDGAGNVKGNVSLRTASSASLRALAGGNGEVSVPTDQPGVFRHNGVVNEAKYIGPEWVIDISQLPAGVSNLTSPPGTSKVTFAFIASQTTASTGIVMNNDYLVHKNGHQVEYVLSPRSKVDTYSVTASNCVLSTSAGLGVLVRYDQVGPSAARIGSSGNFFNSAVSVFSSPTTTSQGAFSIAIGPSGESPLDGTISLNVTGLQSPQCPGSFCAALGTNYVSGYAPVSGSCFLFQSFNSTPGVPAFVTSTGVSVPAAGAIPKPGSTWGKYKLSLMVLTNDQSDRARFIREFDIFGVTVGNVVTVGTDQQAAGMTASVSVAVDADGIKISYTSSQESTAFAFLEFMYF